MNLKGNRILRRIQSLRQACRKGILPQRTVDAKKQDTKQSGALDLTGDENINFEKADKDYSGDENSDLNAQVNKDPGVDVSIFPANQPPGYGDGIITLNDCCFHFKCSEELPDEIPVSTLVVTEHAKRTKESICVTNTRYSVIPHVSKSLGFKLVKDMKLWNILWTDSMPGVDVYKNMKRFQQINHFPGMIEICRKDLLSRNLNRMLKLYPGEYDIFPKTWVFPADLGAAIAYSKRRKHKMFILKPDHCAQGRGIWLTNDLTTVSPNDRMICQLYISKPLLIDGFKFDLRVYALITSVDPLRVFVYNEGLARFATTKYQEPNPGNASDLFMHLTNYAVNKRSTDFSKCEEMGSKRKFRTINRLLASKGYNVARLWESIDDIIVKTILSAWPMLRHNYHACFPTHDKIQACFEILGFDILVDANLKPYILEVNHSPSFHTNQSVDHQVKQALIRDTLTLVGTMLADKQQIIREDRKRVRRRLLNKPELVPSSGGQMDNLEQSTQDKIKLSPLTQQIAWEESHLGDFRRIMPPQDGQTNKYCRFFDLQNQASVYSETVASKRREEVTKKLRLEIKQKQEKVIAPTPKKAPAKHLSAATFDKIRRSRMRHYEIWGPSFMSEAEERMRLIWMEDRLKLISDMKVFEMIFQMFYRKRNLNESDITKYPELYVSLQEKKEIFASNEQCTSFENSV